MRILEYKNISKTIIVMTIAIILSNTLLISIVYYNNQIKDFQNRVKILKEQNINTKKAILKNDINHFVAMLDFKYKDQLIKHKKEILDFLRLIPFDKNKSDYIFVYELLNKKGGDNFAKMILNPNRKDLEGKLISTNYTDINGYQFRKKFLDDINKNGDSFVQYAYKKTNNNIEEKISYFYYIKELDWIIAKGIYIDDIKKELFKKQESLKNNLFNIIQENILIFLFFSFFTVVISYFMGKRVEHTLKEKDKKVKFTTKQLTLLNKNLDNKIKQEIEKNKENEQLLMQKSKFIAMGEMISLIAHQWRQPLSELSGIILNLKMQYKLKKLNEETVNNKTKEMENILEFMSQTIEDFRYFFKPNRKKQNFIVNESIQRVLHITKAILHEKDIEIIEKIDTTIKVFNFQNELEQVLLNLITNAKDALVEAKNKNRIITIELYIQNKRTKLKIKDNANGIDQEIIDKIFDPYFTTKDDVNGTGIGLYMSKIIVEKNMKGELQVDSSPSGSCFTIIL